MLPADSVELVVFVRGDERARICTALPPMEATQRASSAGARWRITSDDGPCPDLPGTNYRHFSMQRYA